MAAKKKLKSKNKSKYKYKYRRRNYNNANTKLLIIVTFFSGVLLIISSYAWLSASLNVKIKFFDLVVSTDNGLFISLDGIHFSDSIEISNESLITDLKDIYPTNTNQWSTSGLWPVSSNGIRNSDMDKFDVYRGEVSRFKLKTKNRRFLNTKLIEEDRSTPLNIYIAFDLFLKNVSGSPKSDNLYLDEGTVADFDESTIDEIKDSMTNIINSMRFGFIKIGSTSSKSDVNTIQNLKCNNKCEMIIYEPNSTSHSYASMLSAIEHGIILDEGVYTPTYAVITDGEQLEHTSGQEGTGIPLDTEHFKLQNTVKNFDDPIFQIPNGITKLRAYVWIEGQDIDSLETSSEGAIINVAINFVKDLAGYY